MELLEVGGLSLEPFELERLLEVRMEKKLNEHASLWVYGILKEGVADCILNQVSESTPLVFKQKEEILFYGILQEVQVTRENNVSYVEATGRSLSVLLDVKPKRRSFQEEGLGYDKVAEQVVQEVNAKLTFHAPVKKIENLVLQYNETDWEFLKRLASQSHSVLIPKVNGSTPEILFGVAEGIEYQDRREIQNYSICKKMAHYRFFSQWEELNFTEEDATVYLMKTDAFVFDLGDMVQMNQHTLYVCEASLHLLDSVLTCTYSLSTRKALSAPKIFNPELPGLTLSGTVLKVEGDKIKVHLSIDETQEEAKAYLFPHATPYSAEGNTGWYGMPEPGDTIQVCFPTREEKEAYTNGSLRQGETEKTFDPQVKYLRTKDGKEIKLGKEEIVMTGKDGVTYVRINETTGIEIITDQSIRVSSEGSSLKEESFKHKFVPTAQSLQTLGKA